MPSLEAFVNNLSSSHTKLLLPDRSSILFEISPDRWPLLFGLKPSSNPSVKSWRGKPFPIYERLANIFGKDRATGHGAQTPIDFVNDIIMEPDNNQFDDVGFPMSMNQTHSQLPTKSQLRGKRKAKSKDDDIVSRLNNVADKFIDKLAT
nr:uncharacterized protein LOC107424691 [Ziziphus jujuba var. spinosa]